MELKYDKTALDKLCDENKLKYLGVFGSVSRDEYTINSDIDLIVDYAFDASLFDHMAVSDKLEKIFKRKVDLVTKRSISPYIKEKVLSDLKDLYVRE